MAHTFLGQCPTEWMDLLMQIEDLSKLNVMFGTENHDSTIEIGDVLIAVDQKDDQYCILGCLTVEDVIHANEYLLDQNNQHKLWNNYVDQIQLCSHAFVGTGTYVCCDKNLNKDELHAFTMEHIDNLVPFNWQIISPQLAQVLLNFIDQNHHNKF